MTMKLATNQQQGETLNKTKWLVVILLFAAGVVANYYYSQVSPTLRMLAWLAGLPALALIASQTREGKQILEYIRESRLELRKITWPTRQEATQTTFMIAVVVVIIALLLWGVDGTLMWLIGWLTGQRG